MKRSSNRYSKYVLGFIVLLVALSFTHWTGYGDFFTPGNAEAQVIQETPVFDEGTVAFDKANPHVQAVMAVQDRNTDALMANPGIVGTATGLDAGGRPAILIFAESYESAKAALLPASIENVPVIVKITGEVKALQGYAYGKGGKKGNKDPVDPTGRFPSPVPTGVSTGHPSITAGTISARVTDGSNVYALSNNHVYAVENNASIGDNVLQPGRFDGGINPDDAIGTLYDFEPIVFSTSANNVIDAAIALSSTANLDNSTPSDGYGIPGSSPVAPRLNERVMKYGRTTSLTKGSISGIHATINVGYGSGVARFVDQIIITPGRFSAPGDSGSLIVVQRGADARRPVGLLFAGSSLITVANPIGAVLDRFDVTIDGE
jgi:hypothetical protein